MNSTHQTEVQVNDTLYSVTYSYNLVSDREGHYCEDLQLEEVFVIDEYGNETPVEVSKQVEDVLLDRFPWEKVEMNANWYAVEDSDEWDRACARWDI